MKRAACVIMTAIAAAFTTTVGTANAATGTLKVGLVDYENPSGCYNVKASGEDHGQKKPHVYNDTNVNIELFKGMDCESEKFIASLVPRRGINAGSDISIQVD